MQNKFDEVQCARKSSLIIIWACVQCIPFAIANDELIINFAKFHRMRLIKSTFMLYKSQIMILCRYHQYYMIRTRRSVEFQILNMKMQVSSMSLWYRYITQPPDSICHFVVRQIAPKTESSTIECSHQISSALGCSFSRHSFRSRDRSNDAIASPSHNPCFASKTNKLHKP